MQRLNHHAGTRGLCGDGPHRCDRDRGSCRSTLLTGLPIAVLLLLLAASANANTVTIADAGSKGYFTQADIDKALAACGTTCTVIAPAGTYRGVAMTVPQSITGGFTLQGAGIGATVFQAPVPQVLPVIWIQYVDPGGTMITGLTIDGQKSIQTSANCSVCHGISVHNFWGTDAGPGVVDGVETKNLVHVGVYFRNGKNWIARNSHSHDNGCVCVRSNDAACPASDPEGCPLLPRQPDLQAPLSQNIWTTGFGYLGGGLGANGFEVGKCRVENVTKNGIEAFGGANDDAHCLHGFNIHDNTVRNASDAIAVNCGSDGTIASNDVQKNVTTGIYTGSASSRLTISNNYVANNVASGMYLSSGGDTLQVVGNTVENNCTGGTSYSAEVLIVGNNPTTAGDDPTKGNSNGLTLTGNTIRGAMCYYALYLQYWSNVSVTGGSIQNAQNRAINVADVAQATLDQITIYYHLAGLNFAPHVTGFTIGNGVVFSGPGQSVTNNVPATPAAALSSLGTLSAPSTPLLLR